MTFLEIFRNVCLVVAAACAVTVGLWVLLNHGAQGATVPAPTLAGMASWYGYEHFGDAMANGKPFDPEAMTCACWDWPLGTELRVESRATGKSIVVTITDRGPARRLREQGRIVDLSRGAFAKLADTRDGLTAVIVTVEREARR